MKRIAWLFSLFLSLSFYGQNDTATNAKTSKIGVVTADKMNVVYRGMPNPLTIYLPNVTSFMASGDGLVKDDKGKYALTPGTGTDVIITIVYQKGGGYVSEKHKLKIVDIPPLNIVINGGVNYSLCSNCIYEFSKQELKEAVLTLQASRSFLYDTEYRVLGMGFTFADDNYIRVSGNKVNEEVFGAIDKLKKGDIFSIKFSWDADTGIALNPLKILIKD